MQKSLKRGLRLYVHLPVFCRRDAGFFLKTGKKVTAAAKR